MGVLYFFLYVAVFVLPWLGYAIGYDPPEFRGCTVPVVISFLSVVYMGASTCQPLRKAYSFRVRIHPIAILLVSLVTYSVVHAAFVRAFPKEKKNGRYITGCLRPIIHQLIAEDPSYTPDEALKGANFDTEQVWEKGSIDFNRTLLFLLWATMSLSLASICINFLPEWKTKSNIPANHSTNLLKNEHVEFTALRSDAANSVSGRVPLDEQKLIRFLEELTPGDFARVLSRLPGATGHISTQLGQYEQAAILIRYVKSSNGPGIESLAQITGELFGENTPY